MASATKVIVGIGGAVAGAAIGAAVAGSSPKKRELGAVVGAVAGFTFGGLALALVGTALFVAAGGK